MSKLLPVQWTVPAVIRARLGVQAGKPRAMCHEGHLLLILHAVPTPGELGHQASFYWRSPDGQWKAAGPTKGNLNTLRAHLDSFTKAIDALELRLDKAASAADYFGVLRELGPLHRACRALHRALQEAREGIADPDLISLRDQAGEAERGAEVLYDDAKHGLDFTIAHKAEEQAARSREIERSAHRLNSLAAVFLPVSAICAAFSMQITSGLEGVKTPGLFWGLVAGAFVLGFVLRAAVKGKDV
ncbi:MAG: hypothetical protein U0414_10945 [Polyangiaceae bacterium]